MIAITALAAAVTLPTFGKEHSVDFGNTSDIVSAMCNIAMAGAAVYAALNAKEWITQSHFNHTKEFLKIMTKVNDQLLTYVMDRNGGELEIILAYPLFKSADEQIKIIALNLPVDKKKELNIEYDNTIKSWIEARDYSQVEDHEYTVYPDFYAYLYKLID
ncbi:hypothetical protein [Serratia grimesii]|uniref:hypothetical protein n=1 Tax=Serratia grimesii TaxID=82995 RepID=UPI0039B02AD2